MAQENTTLPPAKKLLDQVREKIRFKHYSISTEKTYISWIRHYIVFNDKRHPADMGAVEVERFLTYLANDRHVSSATQNQALSAILFLYGDVLALDLPWLNGLERSKKPKRLPVVLTPLEVQALLRESSSAPEPVGLIVRLLYGTGMRLMEVVRLRVKDVEFTRQEIIVRDGKGGKDRITMLPGSLLEAMQRQLAIRREWYDEDIQVAKLSAAIMLAKNKCNVMSRKRHWRPVLSSQHRLIRYVTALSHMFCKLATIFVRCGSYWGIVMFQQR
ncbi:phage integrase family protein [Nitrosomonas ureae]|uniref:Phage integrase family protein n=1 Tax=Nitrosomonas ureae TaxID=44577 RepID=A0A2T5IM09_9PROT|nr:phage integrase family protein [Nitrosomonas ureae]